VTDRKLELRRIALKHLALARQAERDASEAAIRAGEALLEATSRVPPESGSSGSETTSSPARNGCGVHEARSGAP
jgi:hypothetical protein